jgi:hypothetical protein
MFFFLSEFNLFHDDGTSLTKNCKSVTAPGAVSLHESLRLQGRGPGSQGVLTGALFHCFDDWSRHERSETWPHQLPGNRRT